MKVSKLFGFFAALLAAAVAFVPSSAKAEAGTGDLWRIDQTSDYSASHVARVGNEVTFRLTLINKNYGDQTATNSFYLVPNKNNASVIYWKSMGLDEALIATILSATGSQKPQIGIYVSGEAHYATITDVTPNTTSDTAYRQYTDVNCSYTVGTGDFALPMVLLGADGKAYSSSTKYMMKNIAYGDDITSLWAIRNSDGDDAEFMFRSTMSAAALASSDDYDLSQANIFIKAIDFDSDYVDASTDPKTWRSVYEGMSQCSTSDPTIEIPGGATSASTVYVWVDKADVGNVKLSDDQDLEPYKDKDGDTITVLPVSYYAGNTSKSFKLTGVTEGGTAKVYLSSFPTNRYDSTGALINSFLTRTVVCAPAPTPYIQVSVVGDKTIDAKTDYKVHASAIQVKLSAAYASDVTVKVTPTTTSATHTPDYYIGLSEYQDQGNSYWEYTTDVSFTAAEMAAGTLSKTLYVYTLGADTSTAGDGITFSAAATGSAASYYVGKAISDTLYINTIKPTVTSPIDDYVYPTELDSGVEQDLEFTIADTYRALQEPYTVEWTGDGTISETTVTPVNGVVTLKVTYINEGLNTSTYRFTNSVDQRMANPFTIYANLKAMKSVTLVAADTGHEDGVYAESSKTSYRFSVKLSEAFSGGTTYAFLVPQDEASSNAVKTTALVNGVIIPSGSTQSLQMMNVFFQDGNANTEVLSYSVELHQGKTLSTPLVTTFVEQPLYVSVTNVAPAITKVSMDGMDVTNGGTMKYPAAKGVDKTFALSDTDIDPSSVDLADKDFQVQWRIEDGMNVTTIVTNLTDSVKYAFNNAGANLVTVRCKDKDMTAFGPEFTFTVNVSETPTVNISTAATNNRFDETANTSAPVLTVELSAAPSKPVVVELTVTPEASAANGELVLSTNRVYFSAGVTKPQRSVTLKRLDGTDVANLDGFEITAKVITTDVGTEGKAFNEMYEPGYATVRIVNAAPTFTGKTTSQASTNYEDNVQLLSTDFTINWGVSDVVADKDAGFTVTWVNSEGSTYTQPAESGVVNGSWTTRFTSSGNKSVTLTVTDKDGDVASRTFYYYVNDSKEMTGRAHGPAAASSTVLSRAYQKKASATEGGLGSGTLAVNNGTVVASGTGGGLYAWNFDMAAKTTMITATPDSAADPTADLDSFFYRWIRIASSATQAATVTADTINPQRGAVRETIALPATNELLTVEAVFSKEMYPEDNVGDLNADGIPDQTMVDYNLVEVDDQTGADMTDFSAYNDDGDYLPIKTTLINGSKLDKYIKEFKLPGLVASWTGVGEPFTAWLETRGLGHGLNLKGVSDTSYSKDEQAAKDKYAALDDATRALWAPVFGSADPDDWTPEAPTDPTKDDTDGDGFTDGWEYMFWYMAVVNEYTGERYITDVMNPNAFTDGTEIPSYVIANAFMPAKTREASAFEDSVPEEYKAKDGIYDLDNDGLSDSEEFLIGTNPVHWDTDGDQLPDGWEVLRGTDPLAADAAGNPDGDFMARVSHTDLAPFYTTILTATDADGNVKYYASLDKDASDDSQFFPAALYYGKQSDGNADAHRWIPAVLNVKDADNLVSKSDLEATLAGYDLDYANNSTNLYLVHNQVYAYKGFDPRTGWYKDSDGYVAARWSPDNNPLENTTGLAVDTEPYSNLDEFRLIVYEVSCMGAELKKSMWETFAALTTMPMPSKAVESTDDTTDTTTSTNKVTATDAAVASYYSYTQDQHGADTDSNGVPDGWELYVGRDPAAEPTPNYDADPMMVDGDMLTLAQEYAGTDSCDAYKNAVAASAGTNGVGTIYANHPGNDSGWFNKFFPTDPDNPDTDADGIRDGAEGQPWVPELNGWASFAIGRQEYPLTTSSAIYGTPADDGVSCCIRGGGMNPCSVDTDLDGLPDAWEMQFAGLPMGIDGTFEAVGSVDNNEICDPEFIPSSIWKADGLPLRNVSAQFAADQPEKMKEEDLGTYMFGGMDPTWAGDACSGSDVLEGGAMRVGTLDTRTGTVRDVDFDHDGLQNFQEYLVQSMRQYRYDDSTTPLEGRVINAGAVEKVAMVKFNNFDQTAFVADMKAAGYTDDEANAVDFLANGYLVRPLHYWDRAFLYMSGMEITAHGVTTDVDSYDVDPKAGFRYMYVPNGASGFVSSDPRKWDSDYDGMDDYWEIFHGLNPVYGANGVQTADNASSDVISLMYGGNITGVANAWTAADADDQAMTGYSPLLYPWLVGSPSADPDGDGLRNLEEAITPNITSPETYHTDPSPAWMTDYSTIENGSYVAQYYACDSDLALYSLVGWDWAGTDPRYVNPETYIVTNQAIGVTAGQGSAWMFAFESNEGFDTDNDWKSDNAELNRGVDSTSDNLNFTDPDRRQAAYFPGSNSAIISRETTTPATSQYDMFRQFTAECWIKPEKYDSNQVIMERVANYGPSCVTKTAFVNRANFCIGIETNGQLYAFYENSDPVASGTKVGVSCQRLMGPDLTVAAYKGKWTHVAATYDGVNFVLYVNGLAVNSVASKLIPANGVVSILQAPDDPYDFPVYDYSLMETAFVLGAAPQNALAMLPSAAIEDQNMISLITWGTAQYANFYKGYIDEVRIWDGARTSTEIKSDYAKRYSFDDVKAQRDEVLKYWKAGYRRNDNGGTGVLPAELVQHYNFCTLPSAIEASQVSRTPSGFNQGVAANAGRTDVDLSIGWWNALPVHSTVYNDYRVLPLIKNTVLHLPIADGSVLDSQYYSESYAGYMSALTNNVEKYSFPNSAQPYSWSNYLFDRYDHWRKWTNLANYEGKAQEVLKDYQFHLRSGFVGTSDLIPLGGVFAKRSADFWDNNGSTDAWADTGFDDDGDGLPDWWETMFADQYGDDLDQSSTVTYWRTGEKMTAAEAYIRDLAAGLLPTGELAQDYENIVDEDANGLPDWWQNLYCITEDGSADSDSDGLSNRAEYLISEVFGIANLNPMNPRSDGSTIDAYRKAGLVYLGEIFSDHDMMEGDWEALYNDVDSFNRIYTDQFAYDPMNDYDADGWSNWAEARAGTNPNQAYAVDVDSNNYGAYPTPLVEMTVSKSTTSASNSAITVKAWSAKTLSSESVKDPSPDATWIIPVSGAATDVSRNLGYYVAKSQKMTLGPGAVKQGSVALSIKDVRFNAGTLHFGKFNKRANNTVVDNADWLTVATDLPRADNTSMGDIVSKSLTGDVTIGTIDYATGEVNIDYTKLDATYYAGATTAGTDSASTSYVDDTMIGYYTIDWTTVITSADVDSPAVEVTTAQSYMSLAWTSTAEQTAAVHKYYLGTPSTGHLREGKNMFEVFTDSDADGVYTPASDDLHGVVTGVDVGYASAKFNVELTETSPLMPRISLTDYTSDREYRYSSSATNSSATALGDSSKYVHVIVTRIGAVDVSGKVYTMAKTMQQIVLDKWIDTANRNYIHEGDLLMNGEYGLDWSTLNSSLGDGSTYDMGAVNYQLAVSNNATGYSLTKDVWQSQFDAKSLRAKPTCVSPGVSEAIVYASHPTFIWSMPNGNFTYTAFRISVLDAENGDAEVWTSGVQPAPCRNADGNYAWEAPLYVNDQVINGSDVGSIFQNNHNYKWKVTMYNAKFRKDAFSDAVSFRMNVNSDIEVSDSAYNTILVNVKYPGPAGVVANSFDITKAANKVRVQAFASPDFAGMPVSETIAVVTNDDATASVKLSGIPTGTYYVRAFVDTDGDYECDEWESRGYACAIGEMGNKNVFTPEAVEFTAYSKAKSLSVFIEDADTDGDWLPDAWEMVNFNSLSTRGPASQTDTYDWYVQVNSNLVEKIAARNLNVYRSLTGASIDDLQNANLAAFLLGVDPANYTSATDLKAAIGVAASDSLVAKGIDINSIELKNDNPAAPVVNLVVSAQTAVNGYRSNPASGLYNWSTQNVVCTVYYRASLTEGSWQQVAKQTFTVTKTSSVTTVPVEITGVDTASGFFKAVLKLEGEE